MKLFVVYILEYRLSKYYYYYWKSFTRVEWSQSLKMSRWLFLVISPVVDKYWTLQERFVWATPLIINFEKKEIFFRNINIVLLFLACLGNCLHYRLDTYLLKKNKLRIIYLYKTIITISNLVNSRTVYNENKKDMS